MTNRPEGRLAFKGGCVETNIRNLAMFQKFYTIWHHKNLLISADHITDLYRVWGIAPSYTNHNIKGSVFHNLRMNWWIPRMIALKINYREVLGIDDFDYGDILYPNQMFLLEEAETFKKWMDRFYPEENTTIEKIDFPMEPRTYYPMDFDENTGKGSFWNDHPSWNYAFDVCYYIETNQPVK